MGGSYLILFWLCSLRDSHYVYQLLGLFAWFGRIALPAAIETLRRKLSPTDKGALISALLNRGKDFVWFGGPTSQWTIIPLGIEPAEWSSFIIKKISEGTPGPSPVPFISGYVGVFPYEQFSPFSDGPKPILMRAKGALLCNNRTGDCMVTAASPIEYQQILKLAEDLLDYPAQNAQIQYEALDLVPDCSDESYEDMVTEALKDIQAGRYYQINLLRYFRCSGATKASIADLIASRGGPFACWIMQGDSEVISFSPEHFVEISGATGSRTISTSPIKGTSPRFKDQSLDEKSAQELLSSKKNLAELHMIIDLMRNDLNRICQPGSVKVRDANKLVSFINVHHLVGSVTGRLRDNLSTFDFLTALCPGGSITGAPKIEVMNAIRQYEGRPRGFFMGHAFMLDENGTFNSSILIRTLQKTAGKDYEFSAGSGIVIHSDPKSERLEIDAKCNVLKR